MAFDLANRDKIDSTRLTSPLRLAPDAIYIDTTDFSIEQIVEKMFNLCNIEPSVNG
ncbi:MAG: (d)CMP kinase [Candidatus Omnitrophica bacterium]|nr:(d)CMP kinase [Candidatus Omnitrophota bacterium]